MPDMKTMWKFLVSMCNNANCSIMIQLIELEFIFDSSIEGVQVA